MILLALVLPTISAVTITNSVLQTSGNNIIVNITGTFYCDSYTIESNSISFVNLRETPDSSFTLTKTFSSAGAYYTDADLINLIRPNNTLTKSILNITIGFLALILIIIATGIFYWIIKLNWNEFTIQQVITAFVLYLLAVILIIVLMNYISDVVNGL